jgi:hypothetical protein
LLRQPVLPQNSRFVSIHKLQPPLDPIEALFNPVNFHILRDFTDMEIGHVSLDNAEAKDHRVDFIVQPLKLLAHVTQVLKHDVIRSIGRFKLAEAKEHSKNTR